MVWWRTLLPRGSITQIWAVFFSLYTLWIALVGGGLLGENIRRASIAEDCVGVVVLDVFDEGGLP
jgi:hypothetical protein